MTNRTVKVDLIAGTVGYDAPIKESSKTTAGLALAQKEAAAAAKASAAETVAGAQAIAVAEKQAAAAAKAAAAEEVTGADAIAAAKKEAAVATKDAAAQETASAKIVSAAQKEAKAAAVEVSKAQKDLARETATTAKEEAAAAKASEDAAKKRSEAYTNTGKKMMIAGAGLVAAFALAEKATTDFDKSLSGVEAVANATATQMGQLRAAALQAGKDTAFTATEAATAEAELVKAGVSVADILGGGLKGALSLAAAGQLDLADAATISANAMNTFGLKGADVGHIADVLAAGANKSAADVKELAYGLQQGGLVAQQTGLTLEDTTAVLSAFADRGLKGADAGTSLKTMLERLNPTTKAAQKEFEALGINAYDSAGKFVGITNVAGQLQDKMKGLTDQQRNQAMMTMFGSDAVRGATVLYTLGANGVKGYTDAVNDSGAASRMANVQMNNLSGDLKQLKGSLDVALIGSGSGANSVLRDMAQEATKVVNSFASLPKPVQEAMAGFAGGAGSALLLVGGLTTVVGKASETRKTLSELGATAEGFKGTMGKVGAFMTGPWGLAIAGAAVAIGIFASKQADAAKSVADFSQSLKDDGDAIGTHTMATVTAGLANQHLYDAYAKLGVGMQTVTDAAMGNKAAMDQVTAASAKAIGTADSPEHLSAAFKQLTTIAATSAALHDQLHAQQQSTAATKDGTTAAAQQAAAAAKLMESAKELAGDRIASVAAIRAQSDAQAAESDKTFEAAVAHTSAKSATAAHSSVTKDATAATKDATAASKADAAAVKADDKAAIDHGKTVNDATAITKAGITATNNNAAATAAASQKKLADAAAATAQANAAAKAADKTAAHTAATNVNATATSTAADKLKAHTAATDANAAAAIAAADKQKANTVAAKDSAVAHSTAAASKSADAAAARDQAKAVRDATTAIAASDRASAAATKAADAHTKATDAHAKATAAASKAANDDAAAQAAAAEAAKEAAQEHEFGTEALKAWAKAAADTSHSTDVLDTSVTDEVAAMKKAKDTANGLKDALDALNGVHIAASKAAIDVQQRVADLTKALHDNGTTMDITTEKGRANKTQVLDLAAAINAHAQAVVDETGSVDAGNKSLDASRQEFDKVLTAAGLSKGQIDEFNKTLLNTPKLVPVTVSVDTASGMKKLKEFVDAAGKTLFIQFGGVTTGVRAQMAAGGLISGGGTETSDSIPIMASKNEFILNAAATRAIGVGNLTRWNAAHGQATGTIVRPQLITSVGGTTPQASASGGAPLHIEHYYESNGGGAQQTAAELSWLLHARGIAA